MKDFVKATNLDDIVKKVDLIPLPSGDPRYVDISAGRGGSSELKLLRDRLKDFEGGDVGFAQFAFTGHRGSGKSTELLRIENDVAGRFTTLHLEAEQALLDDYDYTDLFLWLADALVQKFKDQETPLNQKLAEDVASWFETVTLTRTDQTKAEIGVETGAEAKLGWFGSSVFAKLKSSMVGSTTRRSDIRRELQNKSSELVNRVNLLLDDVHRVLVANKKPSRLLLVFDNLDRLPPEVSARLFFTNSDFLKQLRAHCIYTVPIAPVLAPSSIGTVFEKFGLSMVKVHDHKNRGTRDGINALVEAIGHRVELDAVFENRNVPRTLAKMSGGSVRDLFRLLLSARSIARTDDKSKIDAESVNRAALRLRHDYERALIPGRMYYPFLAQIHVTKGEDLLGTEVADQEKAKKYCEFFAKLLFNGSILEYNGDEMWYDAHPVIWDIKGFKKALADVQAQAKSEQVESQDET